MVDAVGPSIVLSVADARQVVATFHAMRGQLGTLGIQLALPISELFAQIHAATQAVSGTNASSLERLITDGHPDHHEHTEQIGTATAATILGCTPANVRDLAARGTLTGRRISGRWVFDRYHVETEALRRSHRTGPPPPTRKEKPCPS